MMYHTRRTTSAILLAAALATGTVACGTQASSTAAKAASTAKAASSTKEPLAGLSNSQVATEAIADTEAADSVHITGTVPGSGKKKMNFDLTVVHGKGCKGSIAQSNSSFQLIYLGKSFWVMPNQAFYESTGGTNSAALSILSGKWLNVTANGSGLGSLSSMCDLNKLLGGFNFSTPGGLIKGATATINGQRSVKLKDTGDTAYMYVSDAAKPEITRIVDPGSGEFDFTAYDATATITAPPSSKVLDGSKYGF